MSEQGPFPPPGSPPPVPPGSQPQPYPQPYPQPPYPGARAVHKPGAVALRPLHLGDMFDGAFRIIRFNPRATVGAALLVAAVAMALPVAVSAALSLGGRPLLDPTATTPPSADELTGAVGSIAALVAGSVLLQLGMLLVTGIVAHVTHEAATGRRIGLREAWALTRGKRWRLVGLVLLLGLAFVLLTGLWIGSVAAVVAFGSTGAAVLYGVVSGLVLLVVAVLLWVRVALLSTPALMLEPVGVLGALRRAWRLSAGQLWRLLGIALLAGLVAAVAAAVLGLPLGLLGQLGAFLAPERAALVLVVAQALSTVVTTAVTSPFSAAVTTLQYLDQRMRKEAYDVTLLARAGITGA